MKPLRIWTILVIVWALALVFVAAFIVWRKPLKLDTDVFKLTYQFLLIVVLGGAVSLLYRVFEDDRKRRDTERTLQRELHADVVRAYHTAKKIRRTLRAKAAECVPVEPNTQIHAAPYDEHLKELNDTQLNFEFFVLRVRVNASLFSSVPNLATELETIEKYLNKIVSEWERSRFTREQGTLPASLLPRLHEFIGPLASATAFKSDFTEPFRSAVSRLEALITD